MTKNVYTDKLDDIVNEYNNTYQRTIKMKAVDVEEYIYIYIDIQIYICIYIYINFKKEVNNKDPKFKVGNHVRISKDKNIFAKGYTPNRSKEVFVVSKIKKTVPWTYVDNDLNGEEIVRTFYEKELQ